MKSKNNRQAVSALCMHLMIHNVYKLRLYHYYIVYFNFVPYDYLLLIFYFNQLLLPNCFYVYFKSFKVYCLLRSVFISTKMI